MGRLPDPSRRKATVLTLRVPERDGILLDVLAWARGVPRVQVVREAIGRILDGAASAESAGGVAVSPADSRVEVPERARRGS